MVTCGRGLFLQNIFDVFQKYGHRIRLDGRPLVVEKNFQPASALLLRATEKNLISCLCQQLDRTRTEIIVNTSKSSHGARVGDFKQHLHFDHGWWRSNGDFKDSHKPPVCGEMRCWSNSKKSLEASHDQSWFFVPSTSERSCMHVNIFFQCMVITYSLPVGNNSSRGSTCAAWTYGRGSDFSCRLLKKKTALLI